VPIRDPVCGRERMPWAVNRNLRDPGENQLPAGPRDLVNPEELGPEEEEKGSARDDERRHDERIPEDLEIGDSGSKAPHEDTDDCCNECHN